MESLHDRLLDVAKQDAIVMLDVSMVADAIALLKDQPEIIRCRDCKRRIECDYWIENGDEWFCADGERG